MEVLGGGGVAGEAAAVGEELEADGLELAGEQVPPESAQRCLPLMLGGVHGGGSSEAVAAMLPFGRLGRHRAV